MESLSDERDIAQLVKESVTEYLSKTPMAIVVLVMACVNGHMWLYVLSLLKLPQKHLKSLFGRTAMGLTWFAVVMAPLYKIIHGDFAYEPSRILEIAILVIILAMLLQAFIVIYVIVRGGRQ